MSYIILRFNICRELSRIAYHTLHNRYPSRAEKIKQDLPLNLKNRLAREESDKSTSTPSHTPNHNASSTHATAPSSSSAPAPPRQPHVQDAVTSIQALIRGSLVRRMSSRRNFAEELQSFQQSSSAAPSAQAPSSNSTPLHNPYSTPNDATTRRGKYTTPLSPVSSHSDRFSPVPSPTKESPKYILRDRYFLLFYFM